MRDLKGGEDGGQEGGGGGGRALWPEGCAAGRGVDGWKDLGAGVVLSSPHPFPKFTQSLSSKWSSSGFGDGGPPVICPRHATGNPLPPRARLKLQLLNACAAHNNHCRVYFEGLRRTTDFSLEHTIRRDLLLVRCDGLPGKGDSSERPGPGPAAGPPRSPPNCKPHLPS